MEAKTMPKPTDAAPENVPADPPVDPPADPVVPDANRNRTYVVLSGAQDAWTEIGHFDAAKAEDAIRRAAEVQDVESATYVAVPVRSWAPQLVKVEVKRTISVG